MTSCRKEFCKVLTIFLTIVDVAIGWVKCYQMFLEMSEQNENKTTSSASAKHSPCENLDIYWYFYIIFESIGTVLAAVEIYCLGVEIREDNKLYHKCFGKAFVLIVLIYMLSAFPSAILEIFYRDLCVCKGTFSLNVWKHEVRDIAKAFLGGASVIMLQILFHLTEIYTRLRRLGRLIGTIFWCCSYAPNEEETGQGCCEGNMVCFMVSMLLAVAYIAVFVTETVYIFCDPYKN